MRAEIIMVPDTPHLEAATRTNVNDFRAVLIL
jgi:hypothetical protein